MTLRSGVSGRLLSRWLLAEAVRQNGDAVLGRPLVCNHNDTLVCCYVHTQIGL